jgi:hypothetical protein
LIAMKARQLVVGCVLALGGIGVAAAASMDTRDLVGATHSSIDSGNRESGASTGTAETTTAAHDGNLPCPANGNGSGGANPSGGDGGNSHEHHGGLSWQSLLPGSIQ